MHIAIWWELILWHAAGARDAKTCIVSGTCRGLVAAHFIPKLDFWQGINMLRKLSVYNSWTFMLETCEKKSEVTVHLKRMRLSNNIFSFEVTQHRRENTHRKSHSSYLYIKGNLLILSKLNMSMSGSKRCPCCRPTLWQRSQQFSWLLSALVTADVKDHQTWRGLSTRS